MELLNLRIILHNNVTKIRIVKYTQIIEIINTEYSEINNDR